MLLGGRAPRLDRRAWGFPAQGRGCVQPAHPHEERPPEHPTRTRFGCWARPEASGRVREEHSRPPTRTGYTPAVPLPEERRKASTTSGRPCAGTAGAVGLGWVLVGGNAPSIRQGS